MNYLLFLLGLMGVGSFGSSKSSVSTSGSSAALLPGSVVDGGESDQGDGAIEVPIFVDNGATADDGMSHDDEAPHDDGATADDGMSHDDEAPHDDGATADDGMSHDDEAPHDDGATADDGMSHDDEAPHDDGATADDGMSHDDEAPHDDGATADDGMSHDDEAPHDDGATADDGMSHDDEAPHDDGATADDGMSHDDEAPHDDGATADDGMSHDDEAPHDDGATADDGMSHDDEAPHDDGATADDGMSHDDEAPHDDGATADDGMSHDDEAPHDDGATADDGMSHDDEAPHDDGATANDGMSHDHAGGHSEPDIAPPGVGASQSQISNFLAALANAPESHVHAGVSDKMDEHVALMELVERGEATHVAIGDGDWTDRSIWAGGEVPGDNAKVLIPDGVTVRYGDVSDDRIFTVRIDGALEFATDVDSRMVFDTMVVSPTGHLIIGSESDPVAPDVSIDLVVANNGRIDTDWDPMLLSRGLISNGEVSIHGAPKDSHIKVSDDPMAGDVSVTFDEVPVGWKVGDTIVVAGTRYEGHKYDKDAGGRALFPNEDEIRIITQIDEDGEVHFDEPLLFDHDTPRDDLSTSVANYTRNVSIETENAEEAEVFERGHVMLMHSNAVDVRYFEVHEMGRTDKSQTSVEANSQKNDYDTNVQGRYSLHLHRAGTDDLENPAILEGNSVFGSPGWGVVHHDSNAVLSNNATYDTFGAGYVAETGNETGAWSDNIAIYAAGISWDIPKNASDISSSEFDVGRGGDGFWFQGRMVSSTDNVAASVNTGFVYFHRNGDDRMIDFDSELFAYPDALFGQDDVDADDTPILMFKGNETFASKEGLHVVKAGPNQGHDVWSQLEDFTAWSVKSGAHLEYTSHYILSNFDLIAKEPAPSGNPGSGISMGTNTSEIVIIDAQITGFEDGIDLNKGFTRDDWTNEKEHNYTVIDAVIDNVGREFVSYDASQDSIISRSDLPELDPDLRLDPLWMESGDYLGVKILGTKTDTLGVAEFPGGTDDFQISHDEIVNILNTDGYWTTSDGDTYFLADIYFTDRVSGNVFYETHPVWVPEDRADYFGRVEKYKDTINNGIQDIVESAGERFAGTQVLDVAVPAASVTTIEASKTLSSGFEVKYATAEAFDEEFSSSKEGDPLSVTGVYKVAAGDVLSVDKQNQIEFEGDEKGVAFLDFDAGAIIELGSMNGEVAKISEINPAYNDAHENPLSAIDIGGSTLRIDLSGISETKVGSQLLMDVDEIFGGFDESSLEIYSLGSRNASVVIDYESDEVSLELSAAGSGSISVLTIGEESTTDSEQLWNLLTENHGSIDEHDAQSEDDEDLQMAV